MSLEVRRKWYFPQTTIGELFVYNEFFCYTLEDTVRAWGIKVDDSTAIPQGDYRIAISHSPSFQRDLPLIYTRLPYHLEAGGISFKGIRFHGGNRHPDSAGCILVGKKCQTDPDDPAIWDNDAEIGLLDKIGECGLTDLKVINLAQK